MSVTDKKTVLFFGDSLTFGFDANTNDRHDFEDRWTSMVEEKFYVNFRFIVEGQGGRTIDNDDGTEGKNGLKSFTQAIYSHLYLDYVFIMLGTNNLKERFRLDAKEIANKFKKYQEEITKFEKDWEIKKSFKVILVAPPKIYEDFIPKDWGFIGSQKISDQVAVEYQIIVTELGWEFIDASEIKVDQKDGVHLDEMGNKELADLVSNCLENELSQK